jgi:phage regulator Rha-like protein
MEILRESCAMATRKTANPVQVEHITQSILILRGHRVLLDSDLANLYGVTTKRFNEQVRRNLERFPTDFMFQITADEADSLRSQFATLKRGRGQHRKYAPYVFTEHGAIMAAMILNSPQAIEMSVHVVRAFVQLREMLASNQELAQQLKALEARMARKFAAHDHAIADIIKTIRQLMNPPEPKKRSIGFVELEERK